MDAKLYHTNYALADLWSIGIGTGAAWQLLFCY